MANRKQTRLHNETSIGLLLQSSTWNAAAAGAAADDAPGLPDCVASAIAFAGRCLALQYDIGHQYTFTHFMFSHYLIKNMENVNLWSTWKKKNEEWNVSAIAVTVNVILMQMSINPILNIFNM